VRAGLALLGLAATTLPLPLTAQRFVIGVAGAGGDYREVSNDLRYRVSGVGAMAMFAAGRVAAEVSATGLTYTADGPNATRDFKAVQFDGYLRVLLVRGVSVETGLTNRQVDAEFEYLAQSAAAVRLGLYSAVDLGRDAGAQVRVNYLAGARFSGGGTAPLAVDVGLGFYYGVANGRLRLTGESQFQRFNRTIDPGGVKRDVPIQQIIGKLGFAVVL